MATKTNKGNDQEAQRMEIERAGRTDGDPGGELTMDDNVVRTIAGLAAREIGGIHRLGKSRLTLLGDRPTRGVGAEVGKREAAIDIDVVIEYGHEITAMAEKLRMRVAEEVNRMAGREVVEVNINVHDVHLPETDEQTAEAEPRVH